jgi:adenylate cyclase
VASVPTILKNLATGDATGLDGLSLIGRNPDCTIQISDPGVSRRHAMIRHQSDGFWLFDLGSFNGTYLNDKRVTTSVKLKPGDVIDLLGHQFRFETTLTDRAGDGSDLDIAAASTMARMKYGEAILLVSDIQGFTALSEKLNPDQLAPIIGSWYGKTEAILARFGATLDKFIGDSVLAYWTDVSIPTRIAALRTMEALQKSAAETAEAHGAMLAPLGLGFATGAALHLGRVAYGGMSAREFTLLGDAVNLTFRIEALTRSLQHPALVSAEFLQGWPEGATHCSPLGEHQVKGRVQPVRLFGVERIPTPDGKA